jgi:hypothetical protein
MEFKKKGKGLDFYIAPLTEQPTPLYTVGRVQARMAEE